MVNHKESHTENTLCTAEHIELFDLLSKMVSYGQISETEKESLLSKSGLTKIKADQYKDANGAVLKFNVKQ
jgi:hypothetical protein